MIIVPGFAQYSIASLNADDIIDQKNLYIKMMQEPTAYDPQSFGLGLSHPSLTHQGVTPMCVRYIRDFNKEITAETGVWRLWNPAKNVPRAEIIAKQEMNADPEENKRIQHNIDNTLDKRKEGKPNPLDEPLDPPRNVPGAKGEGKGEKELREKERKKVGGSTR